MNPTKGTRPICAMSPCQNLADLDAQDEAMNGGLLWVHVCGDCFRCPGNLWNGSRPLTHETPKPMTLAERFWTQVVKGPTCWGWSGRTKGGYGYLCRDRRDLRAHRFSWELHHGPIPPGLVVCHRCDNPPCCNPDHLFLGTPAENAVDMHRKGRAAVLHGVLNPNRKLTPEQVLEIRARRATGESQKQLARSFGVSKATVQGIEHGRAWSRLPAG